MSNGCNCELEGTKTRIQVLTSTTRIIILLGMFVLMYFLNGIISFQRHAEILARLPVPAEASP